MENREYYEDDRSEMEQFIGRPPKRTIEFGCSSGGFSERLKQKYNCETWGIDVDEQSVEIAKTKMDNVFCGDAFEQMGNLPENYFDYIICNDFIEHIHSPEQFFEKVKKHLTGDAILICSLPNVRHWKHVNRYLVSEGLEIQKKRHSGLYTSAFFHQKKYEKGN